MAVGVQVWSQTPANNATSDSNINFAEGQAPSSVNDSARSLMASVARWRDDNNGTLVTSGTSSALTLVTNQVEGALTSGFTVDVVFGTNVSSAATLAVDGLTATPLQLYNGASLLGGEFKAGSRWCFTYTTTGTGQWIARPTPAFTTITAALAGDVACNNIATFFAGPRVAQGAPGVWYVSGTVTCLDTVGAAQFQAEITDGSTNDILYTAVGGTLSAGSPTSISVSGVITTSSTANDLRIAVRDVTSTNGLIKFNVSGLSKDSNITAVRIG